jgi:hypothetical protein
LRTDSSRGLGDISPSFTTETGSLESVMHPVRMLRAIIAICSFFIWLISPSECLNNSIMTNILVMGRLYARPSERNERLKLFIKRTIKV